LWLLHVHVLHSLLLPQALAFDGFFIEQWFDAYPASFRTEMPAQSVSTSKASATSPLPALFELSFTDELLLSRMKALMAFSVMLTSKRLATYGADKRTLVSMGP
jgi:hypothetical protein